MNKEGRPTAITTSAWQNGKPVLYTALDDELEHWSAPVPIEAKIRPGQDTSKMVCWDPDIWVDGNTTYALQGVHPLLAGREATVLKSTDQRHWEYVGPFLSREMPDVMRNAQRPEERGHLLPELLQDRRQVDAPVHQPHPRLPLLPG